MCFEFHMCVEIGPLKSVKNGTFRSGELFSLNLRDSLLGLRVERGRNSLKYAQHSAITTHYVEIMHIELIRMHTHIHAQMRSKILWELLTLII
jgi:hypothetical protein